MLFVLFIYLQIVPCIGQFALFIHRIINFLYGFYCNNLHFREFVCRYDGCRYEILKTGRSSCRDYLASWPAHIQTLPWLNLSAKW